MGSGRIDRGPAPALPVLRKEGGEIAARQPYAVAAGQQPQDSDLIQHLAQKAERHVKVHGEQSWRERQAGGQGCHPTCSPPAPPLSQCPHLPVTVKRIKST